MRIIFEIFQLKKLIMLKILDDDDDDDDDDGNIFLNMNDEFII